MGSAELLHPNQWLRSFQRPEVAVLPDAGGPERIDCYRSDAPGSPPGDECPFQEKLMGCKKIFVLPELLYRSFG